MIRDHTLDDFISPAVTAQLERVECERLVFYKWRYVLMADGFTGTQARRLVFMRWLQLRKVSGGGSAA